MNEKKDIDEIINELGEASIYEGTEVGEMWECLCSMWRFAYNGCSDEFINSLEKEIEDQYKWFRENFEWQTGNFCEHCGHGKRKVLVFKDDEE